MSGEATGMIMAGALVANSIDDETKMKLRIAKCNTLVTKTEISDCLDKIQKQYDHEQNVEAIGILVILALAILGCWLMSKLH